MSDGIPALRAALVVAAATVAGCATVPQSQAAREYLDRAEPLHCEVAALESRLKNTPQESESSAALAEELGAAKARVKAYYQATWPEYVAILKELPFEERKEIYRYADAVGDRCTLRAGKESSWR